MAGPSTILSLPDHRAGVTRTHDHTQPFMWELGFELRSSCIHSEYLIQGAISQAFIYLFLKVKLPFDIPSSGVGEL